MPAVDQREVTVAACPPGTVLYQGDFRTWRPFASATVETDRLDEGWVIRRRQPGSSVEAYEGVYADFRVEVSARLLGPAANRYYFLQFRQVPGPGDELTDFYYRFAVDPDLRSFFLARWEGPTEHLLAPELRAPALIRPPAEWNRLVVEAVGPRLRAYINGTRVAEVTDDTQPWGRLGFGLGTGGEPDGEAVFRDFVVTTP